MRTDQLNPIREWTEAGYSFGTAQSISGWLQFLRQSPLLDGSQILILMFQHGKTAENFSLLFAGFLLSFLAFWVTKSSEACFTFNKCIEEKSGLKSISVFHSILFLAIPQLLKKISAGFSVPLQQPSLWMTNSWFSALFPTPRISKCPQGGKCKLLVEIYEVFPIFGKFPPSPFLVVSTVLYLETDCFIFCFLFYLAFLVVSS